MKRGNTAAALGSIFDTFRASEADHSDGWKDRSKSNTPALPSNSPGPSQSLQKAGRGVTAFGTPTPTPSVSSTPLLHAQGPPPSFSLDEQQWITEVRASIGSVFRRDDKIRSRGVARLHSLVKDLDGEMTGKASHGDVASEASETAAKSKFRSQTGSVMFGEVLNELLFALNTCLETGEIATSLGHTLTAVCVTALCRSPRRLANAATAEALPPLVAAAIFARSEIAAGLLERLTATPEKKSSVCAALSRALPDRCARTFDSFLAVPAAVPQQHGRGRRKGNAPSAQGHTSTHPPTHTHTQAHTQADKHTKVTVKESSTASSLPTLKSISGTPSDDAANKKGDGKKPDDALNAEGKKEGQEVGKDEAKRDPGVRDEGKKEMAWQTSSALASLLSILRYLYRLHIDSQTQNPSQAPSQTPSQAPSQTPSPTPSQTPSASGLDAEKMMESDALFENCHNGVTKLLQTYKISALTNFDQPLTLRMCALEFYEVLFLYDRTQATSNPRLLSKLETDEPSPLIAKRIDLLSITFSHETNRNKMRDDVGEPADLRRDEYRVDEKLATSLDLPLLLRRLCKIASICSRTRDVLVLSALSNLFGADDSDIDVKTCADNAGSQRLPSAFSRSISPFWLEKMKTVSVPLRFVLSPNVFQNATPPATPLPTAPSKTVTAPKIQVAKDEALPFSEAMTLALRLNFLPLHLDLSRHLHLVPLLPPSSPSPTHSHAPSPPRRLRTLAPQMSTLSCPRFDEALWQTLGALSVTFRPESVSGEAFAYLVYWWSESVLHSRLTPDDLNGEFEEKGSTIPVSTTALSAAPISAGPIPAGFLDLLPVGSLRVIAAPLSFLRVCKKSRPQIDCSISDVVKTFLQRYCQGPSDPSNPSNWRSSSDTQGVSLQAILQLIDVCDACSLPFDLSRAHERIVEGSREGVRALEAQERLTEVLEIGFRNCPAGRGHGMKWEKIVLSIFSAVSSPLEAFALFARFPSLKDIAMRELLPNEKSDSAKERAKVLFACSIIQLFEGQSVGGPEVNAPGEEGERNPVASFASQTSSTSNPLSLEETLEMFVHFFRSQDSRKSSLPSAAAFAGFARNELARLSGGAATLTAVARAFAPLQEQSELRFLTDLSAELGSRSECERVCRLLELAKDLVSPVGGRDMGTERPTQRPMDRLLQYSAEQRAAWDEFANMFVECGRDCELATFFPATARDHFHQMGEALFGLDCDLSGLDFAQVFWRQAKKMEQKREANETVSTHSIDGFKPDRGLYERYLAFPGQKNHFIQLFCERILLCLEDNEKERDEEPAEERLLMVTDERSERLAALEALNVVDADPTSFKLFTRSLESVGTDIMDHDEAASSSAEAELSLLHLAIQAMQHSRKLTQNAALPLSRPLVDWEKCDQAAGLKISLRKLQIELSLNVLEMSKKLMEKAPTQYDNADQSLGRLNLNLSFLKEASKSYSSSECNLSESMDVCVSLLADAALLTTQFHSLWANTRGEKLWREIFTSFPPATTSCYKRAGTSLDCFVVPHLLFLINQVQNANGSVEVENSQPHSKNENAIESDGEEFAMMLESLASETVPCLRLILQCEGFDSGLAQILSALTPLFRRLRSFEVNALESSSGGTEGLPEVGKIVGDLVGLLRERAESRRRSGDPRSKALDASTIAAVELLRTYPFVALPLRPKSSGDAAVNLPLANHMETAEAVSIAEAVFGPELMALLSTSREDEEFWLCVCLILVSGVDLDLDDGSVKLAKKFVPTAPAPVVSDAAPVHVLTHSVRRFLASGALGRQLAVQGELRQAGVITDMIEVSLRLGVSLAGGRVGRRGAQKGLRRRPEQEGGFEGKTGTARRGREGDMLIRSQVCDLGIEEYESVSHCVLAALVIFATGELRESVMLDRRGLVLAGGLVARSRPPLLSMIKQRFRSEIGVLKVLVEKILGGAASSSRTSISARMDAGMVFFTLKNEEGELRVDLDVNVPNFPLKLPTFRINAGQLIKDPATLSRLDLTFLRHLRDGFRTAIDDSARTQALGRASILFAVASLTDSFANHFKGKNECAICYSLVHAVSAAIPNKICQSCENFFHNECLMIYYQTSHNTKCPLCRCVL